MDTPDVGETFTAEIDYISSSGNGIIYTEDGQINIGPVVAGSEGTEITATMQERGFANCKTRSITREDYESKFQRLIDPDRPSPAKYNNSVLNRSTEASPPNTSEKESDFRKGETITITLEREGIGGVPIGEYQGKEIHVPGGDIGEETLVKITKDQTSFALAEVIESGSGSSEHTMQEDTEVTNINSQKSVLDEEPGDTSNIEELREKAERSAVDEVPEHTTSRIASEYTRSQAVKEYVKARANGVCEGCGESAPFISKTGEPYLHAHHIHELSDGGADTPDTVVALCPNCHYRIHHGEDGDEYNQELREAVQEIEQKE